MKIPSVTFNDFIEKFPEVDLPITLNDESHHIFSRQNDPLSNQMIERFIYPILEEEPSVYGEFLACFRIKDTYDFHAIVFWKAELMDYQYILATFNKKGLLIDKRVIGGTYSDGKLLTQSVATIDDDWSILVVSGQSDAHSATYDASSSKTYQLELLPEGQIIRSIN